MGRGCSAQLETPDPSCRGWRPQEAVSREDGGQSHGFRGGGLEGGGGAAPLVPKPSGWTWHWPQGGRTWGARREAALRLLAWAPAG